MIEPSARGGFDPRTLLLLLLLGAAIFIALLWTIGSGAGQDTQRTGSSHAASRGLDGYAAAYRLLDLYPGVQAELSRDHDTRRADDIVVLTPPHMLDAEQLGALLDNRRAHGPTILVLPKWMRSPAREQRGWVHIGGANPPFWGTEALGELEALSPEISAEGADHTDSSQVEESGKSKEGDARPGSWYGLNLSGILPRGDKQQQVPRGELTPVIVSDEGAILAALAPPSSAGSQPLLIIAEPDLVNNYGLARKDNAALLVALVDAVRTDPAQPVVFDLSLNGLGASTNLLTLAFRPPFLAATLCLLFAALAIGWRAFRRYGPALREARAMAFGKTRLVANGAGLLRRSGRLHLLGPPYVALMRRRLAAALGLRDPGDSHALDQQIDHRLAARGAKPDAFTAAAAQMEQSRSPADIVAAARQMKSLERMLT